MIPTISSFVAVMLKITLFIPSQHCSSSPLILEAPAIIFKPRNQHIIAGQSAYFFCKARGNPPPKVEWLLDGMAEFDRSKYVMAVSAFHGTTLRFKSVEVTDDKRLVTCRATNAIDSKSETANLTVIKNLNSAPVGFPRFVTKFSILVEKKGEDATLECSAAGIPKPRIRWYFRSLSLEGVESSRYVFRRDGRLIIRRISEEDEGNYECEAENVHGSILSPDFRLIVRENVTIALLYMERKMFNFKPHIIFVSSDQSIPPGGNVELVCEAKGSPQPTVSWHIGDEKRPLASLVNANDIPGKGRSILTDLSQSLNCTCIAQNSMGVTERMVRIHVIDAPRAPPTAPKLLKATPTTLQIEWDASRDANIGTSAVTRYVVSYYETQLADAKVQETPVSSEFNNSTNIEENTLERSRNQGNAWTGMPKFSKTLHIEVETPQQTTFSSVIRDLKPFTNYTIAVQAVSATEQWSAFSAKCILTTLGTAPGDPPRNIRLVVISQHALKVYWQSPLNANGILLKYRIYYTINNSQELNQWKSVEVPAVKNQPSSMETLITHLVGNTTYFVCLSAENAQGESPVSDTLRISIVPGVKMVLSKPRNFIALPKSHSEMVLHWEPPLNGNNYPQLRDYTLSYRPVANGLSQELDSNSWQEQILSGSERGFILTNLQSKTQYLLRLIANTVDGPGIAAETLVWTKEHVPGEPLQYRLKAVNSTTVNVSWITPINNQQNIRGFYLLLYQLTDPQESGRGTIVSSRTQTRHSQQGDESEFYVLFDDLKPYTFYKVGLQYVFSKGTESNVFYSETTRTHPPVPRQPNNLSLSIACEAFEFADKSCIRATWQPPSGNPSEKYQSSSSSSSGMNSISPYPPLTGYRVRIRLIEPEALSENNKFERNTTNTFWQSIPGELHMGATYEFQVSAFNDYEIGHSSSASIALPEIEPSSTPTGLIATNWFATSEETYPSEATSLATSIQLKWNYPDVEHINGVLLYHEVFCRVSESEEDISSFSYDESVKSERSLQRWVNVSMPESSVTIHNLLEQSNYVCNVRAANKVGVGPWSDAAYFRTKYWQLPPPKFIRALRMDPHQILVTWQCPTTMTTSYSGFLVWYSHRDEPHSPTAWKTTKINDMKTVVYLPRLDSTLSYVIRVSSLRKDIPEDVQGIWSEPVLEEPMPRPEKWQYIRDPRCYLPPSSNKDAILMLSWQPPVSDEKHILQFRVNYTGLRTYINSQGVLENETMVEHEVCFIHSTSIRFLQMKLDSSNSQLQMNTFYTVGIQTFFTPTSRQWGGIAHITCRTGTRKPDEVTTPQHVSLDSTDGESSALMLQRANEKLGPVSRYHLILLTEQLRDIQSWKQPTQLSLQELLHRSNFTVTPEESQPQRLTRREVHSENKAMTRLRKASISSTVQVHSWNAATLFGDPFGPPHTRKSHIKCPIFKKLSPNKRGSTNLEKQLENEDKFGVILVHNVDYRAVWVACVELEEEPGAVELSSVEKQQNLCTVSSWSSIINTAHPVPPSMPADDASDPRVHRNRVDQGGSVDDSSGLKGSQQNPSQRVNTNSRRNINNIMIFVGSCFFLVSCTALILVCYVRNRRRRKQRRHILPSSPDVSTGRSQKMHSLLEKNSHYKFDNPQQMFTLMSGISQPIGDSSPFHINGSTSPLLVHCGNYGDIPPSLISGNLVRRLSNCGSLTVPSVDGGCNGGLSLMGNASHMSLDDGVRRSHFSSGAGTDLNYPVSHPTPSIPHGNGHLVPYDDERPSTCIPKDHLGDYIAHLQANDGVLFQEEYESIDPGKQFTWHHANAECNQQKNRYANVVAYDHSRVKLQLLVEEKGGEVIAGSDYINANYLDGYSRKNVYIATQGPLPETVNDFWRMVWEQRCSIIVMMTRVEERFRMKCDQYWPSRGSNRYGHIRVSLRSQIDSAYYVVRTMELQMAGSSESRQVNHLQFTAWPDHGVPQHNIPLLLFLRRVRAFSKVTADCGPLVVHCSAGVGRTGAFIALFSQLERMQAENSVDIYAEVTALRGQRNYMVQTEEQYQFVYQVLLEAAQCGFHTEILIQRLPHHMSLLNETMVVVPTSSSSYEQQQQHHHNPNQYNADMEFQPDSPSHHSTVCALTAEFLTLNKLCNRLITQGAECGNSPVNEHKNRLISVLPFEQNRVPLESVCGIEGSDYINASFVDGYSRCKAYIATQAPLLDTVEDFWRMLWEQNSCLIVMLCQLQEGGKEKCCQYWPPVGQSTRYNYLVVDPVAEYRLPSYTLREFQVIDARDNQSRTIRQFHFLLWPELGVPQKGVLSSMSPVHEKQLEEDPRRDNRGNVKSLAVWDAFCELLSEVQKTQEQFGLEGPITVHCSGGTGRTGIFLALSILLERVRYEGLVDIYLTVKHLRAQRSLLVHTEDQYRFCYQCLLHYVLSFDSLCSISPTNQSATTTIDHETIS